MLMQNNQTKHKRIIKGAFNGCENAWLNIREVKAKAKKRRKLSDRETCLCAFSYGATITGKKYSNMDTVNGQIVRPDDHVFFKNSGFSSMYYEHMARYSKNAKRAKIWDFVFVDQVEADGVTSFITD